MLLRRVPTGHLPRLLNHRALDGTPLHLAAKVPKVDTIALLLDAGAQLELEGSEHGTPLMVACATGRDAAVKSLVARGARTSYVKDGEVYSAFTAAKYHPPVRRLLACWEVSGGSEIAYVQRSGVSFFRNVCGTWLGWVLRCLEVCERQGGVLLYDGW